MTDNSKLTVSIMEMSGAVGKMKASQLSHLIEGYIKEHPEIAEPQDESEEIK
jgi:hypothetical protein